MARHLPLPLLLFALAMLGGLPPLSGRRPEPRRQEKPARKPTGSKSEAARWNNLGVAYMDQQQAEKALRYFQKAYAADPQLYAARLNQGIALLSLQRYEPARKIFIEAAKKEPRNPRAWYNLGLLEKTLGNAQPAIDAFERVAALDANDADSYYFLGLLEMQLQQFEKAIAAYDRALTLNPFHVSAEFGLAQAYVRSGNAARARQHVIRFQHLTEAKLGTPMSLIYGDEGKYSLAEQVTTALEAIPPMLPVRFVPMTAEAGLPTHAAKRFASSEQGEKTVASFLGSGACVLDFDGDGRPDVFLVNANGDGTAALYRNTGDRFVDVTRAAGLAISGEAMSCAAGDYDNDGRTDLAVSFDGRVALYRNLGNGMFQDVTKAAGIHMEGLAMGLTFVDYDHDGDLDLYVTRLLNFPLENPLGAVELPPGASAPGNVLWRNNGNGTFTDVTSQTGLAGNFASIGALSTDMNDDRATDLVVTGWGKAPVAYLNPREGKFRAVEPWDGPMTAPTAGAVALDFDKDGWMDLAFTHLGPPGLTLWRNVKGKKFEAVHLPHLGWTRGWGVAALDYDNDGWVDLVAVGENAAGGQIALLRNEGPRGFRNVTHETGLDEIKLQNPRAIVALDYDGDGATDLLITQNGGPPILLKNEGGSRNNWLRLALRGVHDNKSAIGTKVELFAGALRQKWEIAGASGYLSQGPMDITAGMGAEREADIVRMLWPTGVLQDEIQLPARTRQTIAEIDRRGSSCPIVFVWNGEKFKFLADIIGPGIVGHWIAPGRRNIPDPDEYLKVDGSQVGLRRGRISFRMLEPMEELDYLDQIRLLAVDHPAGIEVYPNERFASQPPFPAFKVIASRDAHAPAGAWDDRGHDVRSLLLHRDRQFVQTFSDLPFQGFAARHALELDLGPWDPARPLRLLLDGFTDYFTANSMYAAWQAGVEPVPPYVEALNRDGRWVRVVDDMGFPAGLERTMVADLTGRLPAGTRRIRIVTNLKIYWDRIRIDNSRQGLPYRLHEVPLEDARLEFRGYPRAVEGNPRGDLTYVYEEVSPTGPYGRQAGNYTRYGDVTGLVRRIDEKYVVFGSGDEVAADFDASSLPLLPRGWVRDYFLYADGFAKDMDFYADYGETVDPLPIDTLLPYPYPQNVGYPLDTKHLQYLLRFNTRAVSRPAGDSYRFYYRNEPVH